MNLLLIDNNIDEKCWGAEDLRRTIMRPGLTLHTRRAPHLDLPSSPVGFDRVIVSGSKTSATEESAWVSRLLNFIRSCVEQGKPFLGVCFGHQMLVRSLGELENVGRSKSPEVGWSKIEVIAESPPYERFRILFLLLFNAL
jgi:GMP synthase-like glutamine amidotransferase